MNNSYFFKPWIGKSYGRFKTLSKKNIKLLIIGESHYGDADDNKNFTGFVINKHIKSTLEKGSGIGYFSKIYNFFNYIYPIKQEQFWNSVAFYDYVQSWVENKRIRPTAEQFKESANLFMGLLSELKPDVVIFTGKQLWYNTPNDNYTQTEHTPGEWEFRQGFYQISAKKIWVTFFYHPSSSKFNHEIHKKHLLQFMKKASFE